MKRILTVAVFVFFPAVLLAQVPGERFGVFVGPAVGRSVSGTYYTGTSMPEMLLPGAGAEMGISVEVSRHYAIRSSFLWMALPFKEEYRPNRLWKPAFELPAWLFTNEVRFVFSRLQIGIPFGAGIYFWRFSENSWGSDPFLFEGEKLQKMSFGIHAGVRLAWNVWGPFELFVEAKGHHIFAKDKFLFGEKFTEQGILLWQSGLQWWFWRRNPLKNK
jgi:hypothetical protein